MGKSLRLTIGSVAIAQDSQRPVGKTETGLAASDLGLTPPGYDLTPLRGCADSGAHGGIHLGLTPPGYDLSPLRGCADSGLHRGIDLGLTPLVLTIIVPTIM